STDARACPAAARVDGPGSTVAVDPLGGTNPGFRAGCRSIAASRSLAGGILRRADPATSSGETARTPDPWEVARAPVDPPGCCTTSSAVRPPGDQPRKHRLATSHHTRPDVR